MSCLHDGIPCMNCLGSDDAIVAEGQFPGIAGRARAGRKFCGPGKPQAVLADRVNVILPDVIRPNLDFTSLGEMGRKQTVHRSATDNANSHARVPWGASATGFHRVAVSGVSCPAKKRHGTSARHSPSVWPTR